MPTLIFDCDGVLADTEADGHRVAFNQAFTELGVPLDWSVERYGELLAVGGGKERLRSVVTPDLMTRMDLPDTPDERDALVARCHRRKTEIYTELVGTLPPRPGIARIVEEAAAAGWGLAVCSTSAQRSVEAVLTHAVGAHAARFTVFAGDVVERKKPAPDIYLLAVSTLGLAPGEAVVVEDSGIGLAAAVAAGLPTVVTVSGYTAGEDFAAAALVVSSLGDANEPTTVLADPLGIAPGPLVVLDDVARVLEKESR